MASNFRVVIVGGAFGGLTLAMALERYGIDYVLLESKSSFTPDTGATIGLQPRGNRILDQLGVYDQVLATKSAIKEVTWVNDEATRRSDKTVTYMDHVVSADTLTPKFGYGFIFNRRQVMLRILWSGVQHKEKCLTNKKVTRIEERGDKVIAFCGDEEFSGDVLVGADGIRSIARNEMWRIGNEQKPGTFDDKEMNGMNASIRCLYGYSKPGDYGANYDRGCFHCAVGNDRGMMCFMAVDRYCFWAVYERLDRKYKSHEIPRYTEQQGKDFAETMRDVHFSKDCNFGKILDNVEFMHLAPLEEVTFKNYRQGRILCIGDSVHKTTPHIGIGANFAIEAAADAANAIKRLHDGTGSLSEYPSAVRLATVADAYKDSFDTTRMMMKIGLPNKILMHTFLRFAPDVVIQWSHPNQAESLKLDYLPVPSRSVTGWMPFNPSGVADNIWIRMLVALPLFYLPARLDPQRDYVLYATMLLEAARRVNVVTFTALPNLTLLAFGPWALPVWFWLQFVFAAPLRRYQCATARLMNVLHARLVLPVAAVGLYFGFVWAAGLSALVSVLFAGTINTDWRDRPFRDVGLVRATGLALSVVAAVDWWVRDQTWSNVTVGALAWMGLLYADLFRLVHVKWWQLLVGSAAVPAVGPNAALGLAWTYREEVLRTSRDKNAIISVDSLHARVPNGSAHAKTAVNGSANGSAYQNGSAHGKASQNGHAH